MGELLEKCRILDADDAKRAERLYGFLTLLDSKASALMTFDGVLAAAAAFLVDKDTPWGVFHVPAVGGWRWGLLLSSLLATALCLYVARISYPILGRVTRVGTTLEWSAEHESLEDAIRRRTRLYRVAWRISVLSVIGFAASLGFSK